MLMLLMEKPHIHNGWWEEKVVLNHFSLTLGHCQGWREGMSHRLGFLVAAEDDGRGRCSRYAGTLTLRGFAGRRGCPAFPMNALLSEWHVCTLSKRATFAIILFFFFTYTAQCVWCNTRKSVHAAPLCTWTVMSEFEDLPRPND